MRQPDTNMAVPFRQRPILIFNERNNRLRVDQGTLIVTSEINYRCGSSSFVELRVREDDIQLDLRHYMMFPIDADEAEQQRQLTDSSLAAHLRILATPLIIDPELKLEPAIDHMLAFATQYMGQAGRA